MKQMNAGAPWLMRRRPAMQSNLRLRHKMMRAIRRFLEDEEDFVELQHSSLLQSLLLGQKWLRSQASLGSG
eukprot:1157272-Pelagomonas_calceolata.AAC.2